MHLLTFSVCKFFMNMNPRITELVQNVLKVGLFFKSSRLYKVKIFPISFYLFFKIPLTQNYHYAVFILFLMRYFFSSNQAGPFRTHFSSVSPGAKDRKIYDLFEVYKNSGMFAVKIKIEKQTANVVSARNGCARTNPTGQFK